VRAALATAVSFGLDDANRVAGEQRRLAAGAARIRVVRRLDRTAALHDRRPSRAPATIAVCSCSIVGNGFSSLGTKLSVEIAVRRVAGGALREIASQKR
jgi:hypothetical protein